MQQRTDPQKAIAEPFPDRAPQPTVELLPDRETERSPFIIDIQM